MSKVSRLRASRYHIHTQTLTGSPPNRREDRYRGGMAMTWRRYATITRWFSFFFVAFFVFEIVAILTFGPFHMTDAINLVLAPVLFVIARKQSSHCRRHALARDREPTSLTDLVRRMNAPSEV